MLHYEISKINGVGFAAGASVNAGTGISVSNIAVRSAQEMQANFNIAANAPDGNHSVTVTVNGQTSNSLNFFVQIPFAFTALSVTQANLMCDVGMTGFGAQVLYQVVDAEGQPISKSGMTPEETVSSPAGGFSDFRSFATPRTTDASGRLVDIPIGTCSNATSNFCLDVRQEFRVKVPTSAGEQVFFIVTRTDRRDCRDGIRVTVTGTNNQTFTLGTVN
ncbi:MAG: hypothetical protein ACRD63_09995 [Pyrinomonadaceae bacterium]